MKLNGKAIRLKQLEAEFVAAGINVRSLGTDGDELHTYDEQGAAVDLPAGATSVVDAHVPQARVDPQTELQSAISAVRSKAEIAGNTLLTELCDALLGNKTAGRVAGRPV